jgi:hypothetical protein
MDGPSMSPTLPSFMSATTLGDSASIRADSERPESHIETAERCTPNILAKYADAPFVRRIKSRISCGFNVLPFVRELSICSLN